MKRDADRGVMGALATAMLLQFAVGGAVMPFLSLYLQDRGLTFAQISRIFSVSSACLMVFPFFWGMLADRVIPLNRLFTLLNLLALAALGILSRQTHFVGLLISVTAFIACFNPTLMLINPLCFHHLHNPREQFGLLRAWGSLGWIVPSLPIGIWLAVQPVQELRFVLYLAMGLNLVMAVATFWLPHTAPGAVRAEAGLAGRLGYWPALRKLLGNRSYMVVLASFFLMAGSFSLLVYYSPPQLQQLGLARAWIGPVQCVGVVLEILLFRWRTLFIHRWSYATTILVGCLALVLRQLLFAFVDNLWVLVASYLLAGGVIVFFHIAASVLANALAGPEVRATAQTLLVLVGSGLGPMSANAVVSWLSRGGREDLRPAFLFAAALAGLASVLVAWRGKRLDEDAQLG